MQKRTKYGFWYGFNLAAVILIAFFVLGIPLLFALAQYIQNVDVRAVQSQPGNVGMQSSFEIEIENPSATPLNAAEFELSYDPRALLITAIVPHATLCEERFIINNSFNNASGSALFQCGTISPFSQNHGTIATVYTIPLQAGTSSIAFNEQTHVLAHDGFGTDVTRERKSFTFIAN